MRFFWFWILSVAIVVVVTLALFLLGQPINTGFSNAASSVPLETATVDSLHLDPHVIWFNEATVGRPLANRPGWLAIEQITFALSLDREKERTYLQLDSLGQAGVISDTTRITTLFRRSVARGDSTAIACAVAENSLRWTVSTSDDPQPMQEIYPKNATCPLSH
ncbi:MAG: hypothetical protein V1778_05345 [bacterium]